MGLTIASVAYPFAPVTADPVGGAEQVLARLDRALVAAGHRSIVIAPEGSEVAGELVPVPVASGEITGKVRGSIHAAVRERISDVVARGADLVHAHGVDFPAYLPPAGPPLLATLHLPLDWYPAEALRPTRPRTYLQPVSRSQAQRSPPGAVLIEPIENGVPIPPAGARRCGFALILGRICPEKGFDDALDAAARARMPLIMAGAVFPYPAHHEYLRTNVMPRLDRSRRWIGSVAGRRKAWLLAHARCVLVPSKAPETSSLVAMEAAAAGTPVVAYRAGALADIVQDGRTGWLVDGVNGLAEGMAKAGQIDPETCRAHAREHFPLERMTGAYLRRYAELAA